MALSSTFIAAANAQETGEIFIVLLTITHPATSDVARLSSDPTQRFTEDPLRYGTISRGNIYWFLPFQIVLPDSQESAPPLARLVIDNIDRELVELIRSHGEPGKLLIEIVLASSPDAVERTYPTLEVTNVQYDAHAATFELHYRPLAEEGYPVGSFTPNAFPGHFP